MVSAWTACLLLLLQSSHGSVHVQGLLIGIVLLGGQHWISGAIARAEVGVTGLCILASGRLRRSLMTAVDLLALEMEPRLWLGWVLRMGVHVVGGREVVWIAIIWVEVGSQL